MCGIAGILSTKSLVHLPALKKMADVLAHRGPDGEGFWINDSNKAGLAHRRLAIIDLSEKAAQPMHFLQRYTITYNGEIYNYTELKQSLANAGYHFNTESDTEVLLAAYDFYGSNCLNYFDGMFAFAIWDEKEQTLFCARDRLGEKPFYYCADEEAFCFASEMKALWAIGVEKQTEYKMLLNYLSLGHVQNPVDNAQTFYKNIFSLPPGYMLTVNMEGLTAKLKNYFTLKKDHIRNIRDQHAISILQGMMATSVQRRLRSDVPVGCSLSGGLDSSTIAWYMQQYYKGDIPLKSFTASFPGFANDETHLAKSLGKKLGIQTESIVPSATQMLYDFEKLCWHQEEPFPSSSIYAQYKVYELASQHRVKVLLDGQGADELLGGYHRYIHWYLQQLFAAYNFPLFKKERAAFKRNNIDVKWGLKNIIASQTPSHTAIALEKQEYNYIMNNPYITDAMKEHVRGRNWEGIHKPIVTKLNDILHFNTTEMGLEELLRYADRNSMAHGVEVRLPFLQTELVKFIFSLPPSLKIRDGFTKYALRKAMHGRLPDEVTWRTDKVGFEPPQKTWMGEQVTQEYLQEAKQKLVDEKILKPGVLAIRSRLKDAHEPHNNDWRYLCAAQLVK